MVRGDLSLDETRHQCLWRGTDIQLTVTEFLLVKALAARPGLVKSRDQLIDAAYGENIYVDDRTIDSHIKRLRKKFRQIDDGFNHIETLYGIGYRYKEE
jgi:two-component system response regulator ChvI